MIDTALFKTNTELFLNNFFPVTVYRDTTITSLTKETLYTKSYKFQYFESVWNYLQEISKYLNFNEEHLRLFSEAYKGSYPELESIYKQDSRDIIKKYIPNTNIYFITNTSFSKLFLELPPVIYDFAKWAWVVYIYNIIQEDKIKDYLLEDNTFKTFIYNPPKNYFDNNIKEYRIQIEKEMLKHLYKLGWILENSYPEVYSLLRIPLTFYTPDIVFSADPVSSEIESTKIMLTFPYYAKDLSLFYAIKINTLYTLISELKLGCINFIEKFKCTPTEALCKKFKGELN